MTPHPIMVHAIHALTRRASPRRADTRLGLAHARNDRGCRQIEGVNATVLPRDRSKINRVWVKSKRKHWIISTSNKLCHPAQYVQINFFNVLHRLYHEVTRKADSNVSNIIIMHRFYLVPMTFPFLGVLEVPLLPTGICSYISSGSSSSRSSSSTTAVG